MRPQRTKPTFCSSAIFSHLQKRATSTHETHFFRSCRFAVFSPAFASRPVPVIRPRAARITVMLAPCWPQVGAVGCHFFCDVNAFSALPLKIVFQTLLEAVSCPLFAEGHFCATSTRITQIRVEIRDGNGRYERPFWGPVGAR